MKKINKKAKKIVFITITNFTLIVFLVLMFVLLPTASVLYHAKKGDLSNSFIGKKAEYQGIITLWNVDSFEGGFFPRTSFLEKVAKEFEKRNKGAFIKIENMTISEAEANIRQGNKPDMFSFGHGLSGLLESQMQTLSSEYGKSMLYNFYGSGLKGSELKAVAWSAGAYCLLSTTERMENAGLNIEESPQSLLMSNAFSLAYDKTYKKTTKHIFSMTLGGNSYTSAINCFTREFNDKSLVDLSKLKIIDDKYNTQTSYDAYTRFVQNNASVLLGTQRDVCRMQNRVKAGLENDLIVVPLASFTDLVSYISITTSVDAISNVCSDFIKFLLSDTAQSLLVNIGLMSVSGKNYYQDEELKLLQNVLCEKTIVPNEF